MRMLLPAITLVFFICSLATESCLAESDKEGKDGRYVLQSIEIEKKQVPVLLDTRTGKVWFYSEGQSSGLGVAAGERPKFKGITVEGLAYNSKDTAELEKQVDLLHSGGFINKNIPGFSEMLNGELSYLLDLEQIRAIYERSRLIQPKKE